MARGTQLSIRLSDGELAVLDAVIDEMKASPMWAGVRLSRALAIRQIVVAKLLSTALKGPKQ
jgi:hypothetical protein